MDRSAEVFIDRANGFGYYQKKMFGAIFFMFVCVSWVLYVPFVVLHLPVQVQCTLLGKQSRFINCNYIQEKYCTYSSKYWEVTPEGKHASAAGYFGWLCKSEYDTALVLLVLSLGMAMGGVVFGCIGDRYGRKPGLCISMLVVFVFQIACTCTKSFVAYVGCLCMVAMGSAGCLTNGYIWMLESVGSHYRAFCGIGLHAALSFKVFYFIPIMYFVDVGWRTLTMVVVVPIGILLASLCIFVESPKWVFAHDRNLFIHTMQSISNCNNTAAILNDSHTIEAIVSLPHTTMELEHARKKYISFACLILAFSIIYYHFSTDVDYFEAETISNLVLSGLSDLSCCVVSVVLADRYGRRMAIQRWIIIVLILLFTSFMITVPDECIEQNLSCPFAKVRAFLSLLGQASIGVAYAILYILLFESIPIQLRSTIFGIYLFNDKIGAVVNQTLFHLLQDYTTNIPTFIVFIITSITLFLLYTIPETLTSIYNPEYLPIL